MLEYLGQEYDNDHTTEINLTTNTNSILTVPKSYKATKGDDLDEAMANLINMHGFKLPVIRI